MRSHRVFRVLTVAASIGGVSLALNGSAPTSAAAVPVMLAEWTWTGADPSNSWRPDCNWHPLPTCQDAENFPDDTGDNATFPWVAAGIWNCDLVDEGIGELTIEANVDFDTAGGTVTLEVDQLVIDASAAAVSVSVASSSTIKTP